jgi:phosphoribosyl 1,2-cyclic phosphodiesterase
MISSSPTALTVQFRGVRGSTPSPARETVRYGGNTSCVVVRSGDELLILDAGTGIRSLGDDLAKLLGARPINANLLISHTHWDHIQGLPFFAPAYSPHNHIRIIAPNGRGAMLERALKNQMSPMHFPVGLDQMRGLTGVEELVSDHTHLGNFSISVIPLNHPGGCAGFRIGVNGTAIGYLPDHEPYQSDRSGMPSGINPSRKALVDFVRDLDLLILDTQYTEVEYQNRIGWGHGSLPESVALAVEAGVRRLALFHHDPSHDDHQIDQMVEAAQTQAGGSPLIVQGAAENETITLGATIFPPIEPRREDFIKIAAG